MTHAQQLAREISGQLTRAEIGEFIAEMRRCRERRIRNANGQIKIPAPVAVPSGAGRPTQPVRYGLTEAGEGEATISN